MCPEEFLNQFLPLPWLQNCDTYSHPSPRPTSLWASTVYILKPRGCLIPASRNHIQLFRVRHTNVTYPFRCTKSWPVSRFHLVFIEKELESDWLICIPLHIPQQSNTVTKPKTLPSVMNKHCLCLLIIERS